MIFDGISNHSDMRNLFPHYKLISAGMVDCQPSTFGIRNGSATLGIKFNIEQSIEDTEIIHSILKVGL
jgi:hypothetical protein